MSSPLALSPEIDVPRPLPYGPEGFRIRRPHSPTLPSASRENHGPSWPSALPARRSVRALPDDVPKSRRMEWA
jgi:hypothetical protein